VHRASGAVRRLRLAAPAARRQHPMTLAACNTATRHVPPKAPPLPLGGGDLMTGRKKSPETEIGILNVRLHQIGIRGRIWMYLAEGYNFVIVSYVFALKKKKKKTLYISNTYFLFLCLSVAAVCCLCISYRRTDKIPYTLRLRKRSYVRAYVYVRSTRLYFILTPYTPGVYFI